jgi:Helix-turn-helix
MLTGPSFGLYPNEFHSAHTYMTLAELIEEALMTNTDVAAAAGLSPGTVSRMVNGHPTSRLSVRKVLSVLSRKLGRKIEISDIEGLNISD